jgi:short-subunit dehydrogenase
MSIKTVMITGSSSGFGREAATVFSERGWNVVATMRNPDQGKALLSPNCLVTALDVEDPDSITAAVNEGIQRFGGIDVLINNAGMGHFAVFEGTDASTIEKIFQVNIFGTMRTTRAILPHFRARGAGTIINVSSGSGIVPVPLMSLYSSSKHAVEGFSEGLWYELSQLNIHVKIIEPGFVPSTNFVAQTRSHSNTPIPDPAYRAYADHMNTLMMHFAETEPTTSHQVVAAMVEAAEDGKDQLRYIVGIEANNLSKARRETSEETYISAMRAAFLPQP